MKAFTLECKDALLYEIFTAQHDTKQDAEPPESDSEPEYFQYVDEYLEDEYIDDEGDTGIYMGSPTIYTGNSNPFDPNTETHEYLDFQQLNMTDDSSNSMSTSSTHGPSLRPSTCKSTYSTSMKRAPP